MKFIQDINEVFGKWFNGEHLREDEVEFIIYNIILLVLIIVCVILMARIAYLCQWGKRIKWFFEDICHWLGWDIGSYKEESEDEDINFLYINKINALKFACVCKVLYLCVVKPCKSDMYKPSSLLGGLS